MTYDNKFYIRAAAPVPSRSCGIFMAAKSEFIYFLNQAVEPEFQVVVQYSMQHSKMEKTIKKQIFGTIILDKTTFDTVGKILHEISIQEMSMQLTSANGLIGEMKE